MPYKIYILFIFSPYAVTINIQTNKYIPKKNDKI